MNQLKAKLPETNVPEVLLCFDYKIRLKMHNNYYTDTQVYKYAW